MKKGLPHCTFTKCNFYADGVCINLEKYGICSYPYFEAAYQKIIKDGPYEDKNFPSVPGYYTLLVFDKETGELYEIIAKWNETKFEIEDNYTLIAWKL